MRVGKHHYPLIGFGGYFCGSFVRFAQKFIALLCMKIKILGKSDYHPTIERGLPCKWTKWYFEVAKNSLIRLMMKVQQIIVDIFADIWQECYKHCFMLHQICLKALLLFSLAMLPVFHHLHNKCQSTFIGFDTTQRSTCIMHKKYQW